MDWPRILKDLSDRGLTQQQIAEKCGVAQGTVSDLARGTSKNPSFQFGRALLDLHKATQPRRTRAAAA